MKSVFLALCLLLTICSVYAESSNTQLTEPSENLQSSFAQGQKKVEPRHANSTLSFRMANESHQNSPPDLAAFKKRERIRKTISAIGVVILIPTALIFALLGGGALSKTGGSEERKKGIKWIVIAVLLMVLSSYWNRLVIKAMSLLTG